MKKYVLVLISTLFQLAHPLLITAQSSQTVTNGGIVAPISLNGCPTSWTNDIPAIGLPATGTGDIASFRAINTGNSPITATIIANPASFAFMQYSSVGIMPDVINTLTGTVAYSLPLTIIGKASAVSPDQQWVYMQSLNGIVRINALTGAITTFSTPTVPIVYDFVLNASGSLLYATSAGTNQVYVLETSAMTSKAIINLGPPGPGSIDVMALSPDGSTLYAPMAP